MEATLGHGRSGDLYRGVDLVSGAPVVIRRLAPGLTNRPEGMAGLRDQVSHMVAFEDPNCARVVYYAETTQGVYLVSELVDGTPLEALLARPEGVPAEQAVGLTLAVLDGLERAHAKGLVHGDIRPGNIFVDSAGVVKVTDFGLGVPSTPGADAYRSPEQLRGEPVDHRSDLYAAAGVLLEALGQPAADGPMGLLALVASRARATDPALRPFTAEDLHDQLEAAATAVFGPGWVSRAGVVGAAAAAAPPAPGTAPTNLVAVTVPGAGPAYYRHERAFLVAGLLFALLAVGGGGYALASAVLGPDVRGQALGVRTLIPSATSSPVVMAAVSPAPTELTATPLVSPAAGVSPKPVTSPTPTRRPTAKPTARGGPPTPTAVPTAPPTGTPAPSPTAEPSPTPTDQPSPSPSP